MLSNRINIFILIIAPFIYLFPHTFHFIEMGNDFELLYYSYKKYIFEFIRIGHFPLWSPSESLGYSLIFNPFAQYFYPLSWILYAISFVIGDLSKHTYLLYTIFGISIYNLGQYLWLRKLNIDIKYCLIATLITCLGLKINEILRFPNAIHSFCWFPWILYGMTISINKNQIIKSSLIIFFSTIFVLSAGYPYYILYGLILFSSYFFFISFSNVKELFYERNNIQNYLKFFLNNAIPPLLALIIISPWFMGINEAMEITRDRNLHDINFSFTLSSDLLDQIGSWIFPPISIAEGYYYFGSIVTILILFYIINFLLSKNKEKKEKYLLIFFLLFFILNYQFAASENSFLFKFFWEQFDLIKNFRSFSRINILLIPLFSVLICFSLKSLLERKYNVNFNYTIISLVFLILALQIYFIEYSGIENHYWNHWQSRRLEQASQDMSLFSFFFKSYDNYIYCFFAIVSALTLIISKKYNLEKVVPTFIIILIVAELFILSNIQWAIPKNYYNTDNYNALSKTPLNDLRNSFNSNTVVTTVKGNTYFRNLRKFNVNYFDQFGVDAHTKLFDIYFDRNGVFKKNISSEIKQKINFFWSLENNNKVFFSEKINYLKPENFVDDVLASKKNNKFDIVIDNQDYNGDEILISFKSNVEGYITFMDNWSPGWKAFINNEEVKLLKLFDAYKSVKTDIGTYKIKFKYDPW